MARRTKDAPPSKAAGGGRARPKGGRTTPKGGSIRGGRPDPATTPGRYTAPIPREYRVSPWWVPTLMVAFFGIGVLWILLNYVNVLPGGASNWYLLAGLGLIVAGFVTATRWR